LCRILNCKAISLAVFTDVFINQRSANANTSIHSLIQTIKANPIELFMYLNKRLPKAQTMEQIAAL